ncbi:hypothetical protein [Pararhizobium sp. O133]|uniref:hypothetical protein n=1 Tax=Pararhizobium sp. O133 TaxID=3449278 RepID=UPI003F68295E
MSTRDRMEKYRSFGGAADLVRVEVLVPIRDRARIVEKAVELRKHHRERKHRLDELCSKALALYGSRLTDNLDLDRIAGSKGKARIIANALMDRTDARGFVLGRKILDEIGEV